MSTLEQREVAPWDALPETQEKPLKMGQWKVKLTAAQVVDIWESKESGPVIGKRLGVSAATIGHIRLGRTWRHVTRGLGPTPARSVREPIVVIQAPLVAPVVVVQEAVELPEVAAYVRSLGRVNSVRVFKDLIASKHMIRRDGAYVQAPKLAKGAVWFVPEVVDGKRRLLATEEGQALLRELKASGVLTKMKTEKAASPEEKAAKAVRWAGTKAAYAKFRAQRKVSRMAKRELVVANRPAALAELDEVIEASIAKRTAKREKCRADAKMTQLQRESIQSNEVCSE